jgi:hypothetical protein
MTDASRPVKAPSSDHNNADLLVWACYAAGGYERWIDVEELYLKAFELGPNRLGWRTKPDLPDYKKCAKALQEVEDQKRSDHLGLFLKQGPYTRKLSDEGLRWCLAYKSLLEELYGGGTVRSQQGSEMTRILKSVEKSDPFRQFSKTGKLKCELWELAEVLQCLLGSDLAVWSARLDRLNSAADHNKRGDVTKFVEQAREIVARQVVR